MTKLNLIVNITKVDLIVNTTKSGICFRVLLVTLLFCKVTQGQRIVAGPCCMLPLHGELGDCVWYTLTQDFTVFKRGVASKI